MIFRDGFQKVRDAGNKALLIPQGDIKYQMLLPLCQSGIIAMYMGPYLEVPKRYGLSVKVTSCC